MTLILGPPMRLGVTNALIASVKTRTEPDKTPGTDNGNVTARNVRTEPAPRLRAASPRAGSTLSSAASMASTMNGRKTSTKAMITPDMWYIIRTGASVSPSACSDWLMNPLLDSRIIQPKVRTTALVSSGSRIAK